MQKWLSHFKLCARWFSIRPSVAFEMAGLFYLGKLTVGFQILWRWLLNIWEVPKLTPQNHCFSLFNVIHFAWELGGTPSSFSEHPEIMEDCRNCNVQPQKTGQTQGETRSGGKFFGTWRNAVKPAFRAGLKRVKSCSCSYFPCYWIDIWGIFWDILSTRSPGNSKVLGEILRLSTS